jgi:RNA polymerase sigma factor (sigma-70 family)
MTPWKDEANRLRPAEPALRVLYETLGSDLQRFVTRKFGLPPEDAESLIHEAFVQFVAERPDDARAWLTGAACRGAKAWLQRRGLAVTDSPDDAREIENLLFCREAQALLTEHAREALRLRFQEGRTYEEIAAELDVAAYYAEKLVAKAVVKLRQAVRELRQR